MQTTYTIDLTSVGNQSQKTKTFLENATNEQITKWLVNQVKKGDVYIDSFIEE